MYFVYVHGKCAIVQLDYYYSTTFSRHRRHWTNLDWLCEAWAFELITFVWSILEFEKNREHRLILSYWSDLAVSHSNILSEFKDRFDFVNSKKKKRINNFYRWDDIVFQIKFDICFVHLIYFRSNPIKQILRRRSSIEKNKL